MVLKKVKFLLDENVPVKLKYVFTDRKIHCVTIKEEGWLGIKNGELSNKLKHHHFILVTRDKDFTFLWEKYKIQVITYQWQERRGQELTSCFAVNTGFDLYQISFNSTTLGWRLDKIIE